jgi:hypothetical protein|tara:strand:- start:1312 stop:2142 length:831 start_codon:yes stop_codon:yes gene_type:complete
METGENNSNLKIVDKSFNNDFIINCHLSIELSQKSLTYCIIDTKKLRCNLLYSTNFNSQDELTTLLTTDNYIARDFQSKSIALTNYPNTLVPEKIYKEEDKENIFSINHDNDDIIFTDRIKSNNIKNIYSIPKSLHQTLNNIIPDIKIKPQSTILINYLLSMQYNTEKIILYIKDNFVNILIAKNGKLLFQNKFRFTTKEDLLFYTLFCIQELNLSTENINTEVYGNISEPEFQLLHEYIRNIDYGNKLKDINCSNEFNNIEEHCFSILYRQHLCV